MNLDNGATAMVVAIEQDIVTMGTGDKLTFHALYKSDSWNYLYSINSTDSDL
nr:hypothetical protein [Planococcus glaciei]